MKRQKKDDRIVIKSLAMVTQFGLHMLVPICMMSALGVWLDRKLDTICFTIILFTAGAAAGGQNIYRLAKRICGEDSLEEACRDGRGNINRDSGEKARGDRGKKTGRDVWADAAGTAAEPGGEREDDTFEKHE